MCLNKLHSIYSTNSYRAFEVLVKTHVLVVVQYEHNVLLFNFS